MKHPIPDAALDDRLAFIGTAGSGKTYSAKGCVERLLALKHRVVIVDPLDVWYGLRLKPDGKSDAFQIGILGGRHADLPLTESAGGLIGEAVAKSTESCIVSLTGLKTSAARQHFMHDFLDMIYERTNPDRSDPYHIIFDEADLWAPQKPYGREAMLCHLMEEIVRRGRVKGFIPWLISQRPAVLNKNVLSQADGLIALKLTSSQDRSAIKAWVASTAGEGQWNVIDKALPTMQRGQAVAWLPGRGILETVTFPENRTFDSSRTPKRGEKKVDTTLAPLDLGALKAKLATIEEETKADDPKVLRAEIARLTALTKVPTNITQNIPDAAAVVLAAEQRGAAAALRNASAALLDRMHGFSRDMQHKLSVFEGDLIGGIANIRIEVLGSSVPPPGSPAADKPAPAPTRAPLLRTAARKPSPAASGDGSLTPALQKALNAIAWWRKIGRDPVEKARACVVAGLSPKASTFGVYLAELAKRGLVTTPEPGKVSLTDEGWALAYVPTAGTADDLYKVATSLLGPQEVKIFGIIHGVYPNSISRAEVAERMNLSPTASTTGVYIAGVAAYGIVEVAGRGEVKAADWLFPA